MAERRLDLRISAHDNASGVLETVKGKLDTLKRVAGGRGFIKDIAEPFLVGGGALAGVTFLAREFAESGAKAKELADQIATGALHGNALKMRVLESIPIFGSLVKGARDWAEALDTGAMRAKQARFELERAAKAEEMAAAARKSREAFDSSIRGALLESEGPGGATTKIARASEERAKRKKEIDDRERDLLAQLDRVSEKSATHGAQGAKTGFEGVFNTLYDEYLDLDKRRFEVDKTYANKVRTLQRQSIADQRTNAEKKRQDDIRDAEEAAREVQSFFDDADAAGKQLADERAQRESIDARLRQDEIDNLKTRGELGDKGAEQDAKRLEVQERFLDRERELQEILRDELATEEQKARARRALAELPDAERRAEESALRDQSPGGRSTGVASLQQAGFLSGIADASRARQADPVLKATVDGNALTKEQTKVLAEILKVLAA